MTLCFRRTATFVPPTDSTSSSDLLALSPAAVLCCPLASRSTFARLYRRCPCPSSVQSILRCAECTRSRIYATPSARSCRIRFWWAGCLFRDSRALIHGYIWEDYPIFELFSALQETLVGLPDAKTQNAVETDDNAGSSSRVPPKLATKCSLLWAHHLLATSKRKDIQHWAAELQVWAIAKTG